MATIRYLPCSNAVHLERPDLNDPGEDYACSVPIPALRVLFAEVQSPIARIKMIRAFTGCGLKDAKDICDFWTMVREAAKAV